MTQRQTLVTEGTLTLPYGVLRTLHNGASEVRLYRDLVTGMPQVGKRLSLLGREDNLIHEAAFLSEASHRNIAEMNVVTEPTGLNPGLDVVEIMMPYYEAGSVFDALVKQGRRFDLEDVRLVMMRALRGLAYLHEQHRVLHRDIKPANLFLSSDESVVKLGDFGEAMKMEEDDACPPLLSPQFWTPPETFGGGRYSVAAEMYGMGMTLHEMLSGPFPYTEYTVEDMTKRLSAGRCALLPRHLRFQPHVPEALRRVFRKSTRSDPTRRYQSAHEMREAIRRARFINWRWPDMGEKSIEWQGTYDGDKLWLGVRRLRSGRWRARFERRYASGWRQVRGCPEVDGDGPLAAAAQLFSQVERQVVST